VDSRFYVNPLSLASSFRSTGSLSLFVKINLVLSLDLVYTFVSVASRVSMYFVYLVSFFFVSFTYFSLLGLFAIALTWLITVHCGKKMSSKLAELVILMIYSGKNSLFIVWNIGYKTYDQNFS